MSGSTAAAGGSADPSPVPSRLPPPRKAFAQRDRRGRTTVADAPSAPIAVGLLTDLPSSIASNSGGDQSVDD